MAPRLDRRRARSERVVAVCISLIVGAASTGVAFSDLSTGATGILPGGELPSNDVLASPMPTPGYANGNLAYLSGNQSASPDGIGSGCSGIPISEIGVTETPNFGGKWPLKANMSLETVCGVSGLNGFSEKWTWGDGNVTTFSGFPNGTAKAIGGYVYSWFNYSHTYQYAGSFIPQVAVTDSTGAQASGSANVYVTFVPSLFYSFYNESGLIEQGLNGSAYSIGLVEACLPAADMKALYPNLGEFDSRFDLPNPVMINITTSGIPCPAAGGGGSANETNLDIQWAHVAAPGAKIYVCFAPSFTAQNEEGCDTSFYQNRSAQKENTMLVSNSWAFCAQEDSGGSGVCANSTDPYQSIWSNAKAAGMTLLASVGDATSNPCDNGNYDAANPYGLAIGGTTVSAVGPSGSYGSEHAWTSRTAGGSCWYEHRVLTEYEGETSGTSEYYNSPSWQNSSLFNTTHRYFPDVSMVADPNTGVPFVSFTGQWYVAGGTSIGAPVWAGILDMLFQADAPHLAGFAGGFLYSSAALSCFHDYSGSGPRDGLGTPNIGCLSKV